MRPSSSLSSALASCAVVFTAALAAPLAAQAAPLIGLYTFEGANGDFLNVVDSSGNGKNPNFFESRTVSVTTGGQGYQGEAAKFTPTSPWYASSGSITSGGGFTVPIDIKPSAGNLTIGGWLKLKTTAATAGNPKYTFFSHDDGCWDRGLWLDMQRGGAWQTTGGSNCSGPQNTGAVMTHDAWHLVVVSMAGVNASLYIDGVFQSTTVADDYGTTAADLRFGAFDRSGGTEPWEGLMDNLFVFRSALSAADVGTIQRQGLNGILQVGGLAPQATTAEVPEPGSLALAALALCGVAGLRRRRG